MISHLRRTLILLVVVAWAACGFAQVNSPVADPKATVISGDVRFTILTPQLIRMEWAPKRTFEDHASLVFISRRLPVPAFTTGRKAGWLTIKTEMLTISYRRGTGRFTPQNLRVDFDLGGKTVTWHPGLEDKGNLRGTTRTLDGVRGATDLEPGLVSRDGWVLVDDSSRSLFDNSDWPWVMPRPVGERQDWYLFAYGHDYRGVLRDFVRVAGRIPLPPRFAFGSWWSRYWAYTDQEFKQLVLQFQEHDVPLDVLVIDMDWHPSFDMKWRQNKKDQSGHRLGWTGYTWNRTLFPDPKGFLAWAHTQGLKTTMNLHPASGVQPWEEQYDAMARAMGIDPTTKKYVPFDITNKKFAENYLNILHHPLEAEGVDFWWLDWQQEKTTSIEGVNPTWWLNYVHFTDRERQGKRGLLFHRWGGLGNHRYQIGFSGDTVSVWESLAFQPYFTATAANVGYGYWSHDIGGHMPGVVSPELFARWIQFGVFSPILRTHTTKNPDSERRIWAYPVDYAEIMRDAYLLRYALIPYTYAAAREAYDSGISICRPLYYDYPEAADAYDYKDQYMFGDSLLVAPVTTAVASNSWLAAKEIWLPPGGWIEWSTGTRLSGPGVVKRGFAPDEFAVYVKAGTIIPMQPKMRHTGENSVDPLILSIFPGASGATRIYDDAGDTLGYKGNEFTWTTVRHTQLDPSTEQVEILPVEGSFPGMLKRRSYELRLVDEWPPESIAVNGEPLPASSWRYDGNDTTTIVTSPEFAVDQKVEILIRRPAALETRQVLLNGVPGKLRRLQHAMSILNGTWPRGWSPDSLIYAVQTGERISFNPASASEELQRLQQSISKVVNDINEIQADRVLIERALNHLQGMYSLQIRYSVTAE